MELKRSTELSARERRALCGIYPAGCGVVVTYDDRGRIAKVRPDESAELGVICKLGEHSAEIVYSKDRILYPLRRNGEKGTYDFERISWDDAYDIIATKLSEIKVLPPYSWGIYFYSFLSFTANTIIKR